MAISGYEKVLDGARKLPMKAQVELAETLLDEINIFSSKPQKQSTNRSPSSDLEILSGMSTGELKALADAILAPGRQRRLKSLLRKNKMGNLSEREEIELDKILKENDRLALLKAKALYTLQLSQHSPGA